MKQHNFSCERYTLEYALTTLFHDKIQMIEQIQRAHGFDHVPLWVTETGWATDGANPNVANIPNAMAYWRMVQEYSRQYPEHRIYWFELVDENRKPGTDDEHHYGVFTEEGIFKFE